MNSDGFFDDLKRAAKRVGARTDLLVASLIRAWERQSSPDALASALGCSDRVVVELALCLRPRAEHWIADTTEIAHATGIALVKLEAFLRKAEVIERLSMAHPIDDSIDGRLLAARDRDEED
jgi:hypothetical protein